MASTRETIVRIKTGVAELMTRLRVYLDERAEKDKAGWGSHMEYKRPYTNPDAAKRARTPPGELKEERRRTER